MTPLAWPQSSSIVASRFLPRSRLLSYVLAVRAHPCGAHIAVIVSKRYSRRPGETTNSTLMSCQQQWRLALSYPPQSAVVYLLHLSFISSQEACAGYVTASH